MEKGIDENKGEKLRVPVKDEPKSSMEEEVEDTQPAVRKSSRPRKQSRRMLDNGFGDDEKSEDVPKKKKCRKATKLKPVKKIDVFPNGQPFKCSLCESSVINNCSGRPKKETEPLVKEKNGRTLYLCVQCAIAVNLTESKATTPEQRAKFEEEGKQFAMHLSDYLKDADAARLYCSFYTISKCGCIQNYINGTLSARRRKSSLSGVDCDSSEITEPSAEEGTALPDDKLDQAQRAKYLLSLLKEAKALKEKRSVRRPPPNERKNETKPAQENKDDRTKEFDQFVLTNRLKLKDLGICARGCQKVLCYSNNFLHKKTVGSEPRMQRTKGRAALGQLLDVKILPSQKCCVKSCVQLAGKHADVVTLWRQDAQRSQRETWRVISEMLCPEEYFKSEHPVDLKTGCCFKFISMVTGCCPSTIKKVYAKNLLQDTRKSKVNGGVKPGGKSAAKKTGSSSDVTTTQSQLRTALTSPLVPSSPRVLNPVATSSGNFNRSPIKVETKAILIKTSDNKMKVAQPVQIPVMANVTQPVSQSADEDQASEATENKNDIKEKVRQLFGMIKDPKEIASVQQILTEMMQRQAMQLGQDSTTTLPSSRPIATTLLSSKISSLSSPSSSFYSLSATSKVAETTPAVTSLASVVSTSSMTLKPASFLACISSPALPQQLSTTVQSLKANKPIVFTSSSPSLVSELQQQSSSEGVSNTNGSGHAAQATLHSQPKLLKDSPIPVLDPALIETVSQPSQILGQQLPTGFVSGQQHLTGGQQVTLPMVMLTSTVACGSGTSQVTIPSLPGISLVSPIQPSGLNFIAPKPTVGVPQQLMAPRILSVAPQAGSLVVQPPSVTPTHGQQLQVQIMPSMVMGQTEPVIPLQQPSTVSLILVKPTVTNSQNQTLVSLSQPLSQVPAAFMTVSSQSIVSTLPAMQLVSQDSAPVNALSSSQATTTVASSNLNMNVPQIKIQASTNSVVQNTRSDILSSQVSYDSTSHSLHSTPVCEGSTLPVSSPAFLQQNQPAVSQTNCQNPVVDTKPMTSMSSLRICTQNYPNLGSSSQESQNLYVGSLQGKELGQAVSGDDSFLISQSQQLAQTFGNVPLGTPSSCSSSSFVFDALTESPSKDSSLTASPSSQPVPIVTSSLLSDFLTRSPALLSVFSSPVRHDNLIPSSLPPSPLLLTPQSSESLTGIQVQNSPSQIPANYRHMPLTSSSASPAHLLKSPLCLSLNFNTTPSTATTQRSSVAGNPDNQPNLQMKVVSSMGHVAALPHTQMKDTRPNRHRDPPQVGIVHPHVSGVKGSYGSKSSETTSCGVTPNIIPNAIQDFSQTNMSSLPSTSMSLVTTSSSVDSCVSATPSFIPLNQSSLLRMATPGGQQTDSHPHRLLQQQLLMPLLQCSQATTNITAQTVSSSESPHSSQINFTAMLGNQETTESSAIVFNRGSPLQNAQLIQDTASCRENVMASNQGQIQLVQAFPGDLSTSSGNETQLVTPSANQNVTNLSTSCQAQPLTASPPQIFRPVMCPHTGQIKLLPVLISPETKQNPTAPLHLSSNEQLILNMTPPLGPSSVASPNSQIVVSKDSSAILHQISSAGQSISVENSALYQSTSSESSATKTALSILQPNAMTSTQNEGIFQTASSQVKLAGMPTPDSSNQAGNVQTVVLSDSQRMNNLQDGLVTAGSVHSAVGPGPSHGHIGVFSTGVEKQSETLNIQSFRDPEFLPGTVDNQKISHISGQTPVVIIASSGQNVLIPGVSQSGSIGVTLQSQQNSQSDNSMKDQPFFQSIVVQNTTTEKLPSRSVGSESLPRIAHTVTTSSNQTAIVQLTATQGSSAVNGDHHQKVEKSIHLTQNQQSLQFLADESSPQIATSQSMPLARSVPLVLDEANLQRLILGQPIQPNSFTSSIQSAPALTSVANADAAADTSLNLFSVQEVGGGNLAVVNTPQPAIDAVSGEGCGINQITKVANTFSISTTVQAATASFTSQSAIAIASTSTSSKPRPIRPVGKPGSGELDQRTATQKHPTALISSNPGFPVYQLTTMNQTALSNLIPEQSSQILSRQTDGQIERLILMPPAASQEQQMPIMLPATSQLHPASSNTVLLPLLQSLQSRQNPGQSLVLPLANTNNKDATVPPISLAPGPFLVSDGRHELPVSLASANSLRLSSLQTGLTGVHMTQATSTQATGWTNSAKASSAGFVNHIQQQSHGGQEPTIVKVSDSTPSTQSVVSSDQYMFQFSLSSAATPISNMATAGQGGPVEQFLHLKNAEVIDLTDDSPPSTPSKSVKTKGQISSQQLRQNEFSAKQSCLLYEELQKQSSYNIQTDAPLRSSSHVKPTDQSQQWEQQQLPQPPPLKLPRPPPPKLPQPPPLKLPEPPQLKLQQQQQHLPRLQLIPHPASQTDSSLVSLEEISDDTRQLLIASLEAHAAGNPDVQLVTQTFTPSENVINQGFLTVGSTSQQTGEHWQEITKAISQGKCPSAVVTISANPRFQQLFTKPHLDSMSDVNTTSALKDSQINSIGSRLSVSMHESGCNHVGDVASHPSQVVSGDLVKLTGASVSTAVGRLVSTPLALSASVPSGSLESRLIVSEGLMTNSSSTPTHTALPLSMSAGLAVTPASTATAGRPVLRPSSSTVTFVRTTNTPTGAVGPPNITIMSPSRVNPLAVPRFRAETSGSFGAIQQPSNKTVSNVVPIVSQLIKAGSVSVTNMSGSPRPVLQKNQDHQNILQISLPTSAGKLNETASQIARKSAAEKTSQVLGGHSVGMVPPPGDSGTQSGYKKGKSGQTSGKTKPNQVRRSSIKALLETRELEQKAAAASGAVVVSSSVTASSNKNSVTQLFSAAAGAPKLFFVQASDSHGVLDPETPNTTVRNVQLLAQGTSHPVEGLASSSLAAASQKLGFTILQPNVAAPVSRGQSLSDGTRHGHQATEVSVKQKMSSAAAAHPGSQAPPFNPTHTNTSTVSPQNSIPSSAVDTSNQITSVKVAAPSVYELPEGTLQLRAVPYSQQPAETSHDGMQGRSLNSFSNTSSSSRGPPAKLLKTSVLNTCPGQPSPVQKLEYDNRCAGPIVAQPQVVGKVIDQKEKSPAQLTMHRAPMFPLEERSRAAELLNLPSSAAGLVTKSMSNDTDKVQLSNTYSRDNTERHIGRHGPATVEKLLLLSDTVVINDKNTIQADPLTNRRQTTVSDNQEQISLKSPHLLQLMTSKNPIPLVNPASVYASVPEHQVKEEGTSQNLRQYSNKSDHQQIQNTVQITDSVGNSLPVAGHQPGQLTPFLIQTAVSGAPTTAKEDKIPCTQAFPTHIPVSGQISGMGKNKLPLQNPLLSNILFAASRNSQSLVTAAVSSSSPELPAPEQIKDTIDRSSVRPQSNESVMSQSSQTRLTPQAAPVDTSDGPGLQDQVGDFVNSNPKEIARSWSGQIIPGSQVPAVNIPHDCVLRDQFGGYVNGHVTSNHVKNDTIQAQLLYRDPPAYEVATKDIASGKCYQYSRKLPSPPQYGSLPRPAWENVNAEKSWHNRAGAASSQTSHCGRIGKVIEDIYKFSDEGDEATPPQALGGLKSYSAAQKARVSSNASTVKFTSRAGHVGTSMMKDSEKSIFEAQPQNLAMKSSMHSETTFASGKHDNEQTTSTKHLYQPSFVGESSDQIWKSPKKVRAKKEFSKTNSKQNLKKVQFSDIITSKLAPEYGQPVSADSPLDKTFPTTTAEFGQSLFTSAEKDIHHAGGKTEQGFEYSPLGSGILPGSRHESQELSDRYDFCHKRSPHERSCSQLKALLFNHNQDPHILETGSGEGKAKRKVQTPTHLWRDKQPESLSNTQAQHAEGIIQQDTHRFSPTKHHPREASTYDHLGANQGDLARKRGIYSDISSYHSSINTEPSSMSRTVAGSDDQGDSHYWSKGPPGQRTEDWISEPSSSVTVISMDSLNDRTESAQKELLKTRPASRTTSDGPMKSDRNYTAEPNQAPDSAAENDAYRDLPPDPPSSFNILSTQGYSKLSRQRWKRNHSEHSWSEDSTASQESSTQLSTHSASTNTETGSADQVETAQTDVFRPNSDLSSSNTFLGVSTENPERQPSESPLVRHKMLEANFEIARQMDQGMSHTSQTDKIPGSDGKRMESPQKFISFSDRRHEPVASSFVRREREYQTNKDLDYRMQPGVMSKLTSPIFAEQGRSTREPSDELVMSSLGSLSNVNKEIQEAYKRNQFLKMEVAKAEYEYKMQQRQRHTYAFDKGRGTGSDVDGSDKTYYTPASSASGETSDTVNYATLRKRHSSSTATAGILKRSPVPDVDSLRAAEGGIAKSRHPSGGFRHLTESEIALQESRHRNVGTVPAFARPGSSTEDLSPQDHYTKRDELDSSLYAGRPPSQLELIATQYEPIPRHRYPSSEMKSSTVGIPSTDSFIPVMEARHKTLSASAGRALAEFDLPPYDNAQRQRNPSSSSLKSSMHDIELLSIDIGARSRNPSSSSAVRIVDFFQDFSTMRSRNPSGSSNRRSRPGSSSSDRELPLNMDDLPFFTDFARTRSRNSSGDSIEPSMEMLLDQQQIMHLYNTSLPRQNRH